MSANSSFHDEFQLFLTTADQSLATLKTIPDIKVLDELTSETTERQRKLNEVSDALPAYDMRRYQSSLDQVVRDIARLREAHAPKQKFSFKSRKAATTSVVRQVCDQRPAQPRAVFANHLGVPEAPGSLVITQGSEDNSTIDVTTHPAISRSSTVTVRDVSGVHINLSRTESFTSVTLRGLRSCSVQAGSSTGSLFVDSCTGCQIIGEAQQFRIHSCGDCTVKYRCMTGRPVIEDCVNMRFLNENIDEQGTRLQTIVDDFSDLSGSRRNWSVLVDTG